MATLLADGRDGCGGCLCDDAIVSVQVRRVRVDALGHGDRGGVAEREGRPEPGTVAGGGRVDFLAVEEPLEIRVDGRPFAVTMRTPGYDLDLAAGFCLAEGLVRDLSDVRTMSVQGGDGGRWVDVRLASPRPAVIPRATVTASSCGLCGTQSLDLLPDPPRLSHSEGSLAVELELLTGLPKRMSRAQRVFATTGGCHGAALATTGGELLCVREDVGRHNAADKVLGWALGRGLVPVTDGILVLSGRASYELVVKALAAGIAIVVAVSAPSSAAVDLARSRDLTLAAFVRDGRANIYSGTHRVRLGQNGDADDLGGGNVPH